MKKKLLKYFFVVLEIGLGIFITWYISLWISFFIIKISCKINEVYCNSTSGTSPFEESIYIFISILFIGLFLIIGVKKILKYNKI